MPRLFARNIDLDTSSSSSHQTDETMTLDNSTRPRPVSPRSSLASRFGRRRARGKTSKFDAMVKDEQRHLSDEIKTCKSYVRNLQTSYKYKTIKAKDSGLSIMQVLAKKHATDLSEEISLCEQELKLEESFHSIDSSCSRSRHRRPSFLTKLRSESSLPCQAQKAPTAA